MLLFRCSTADFQDKRQEVLRSREGAINRHSGPFAGIFSQEPETRNPVWRGVEEIIEIDESQLVVNGVAEREGFEPSIRD
jgi:hypothetical protein